MNVEQLFDLVMYNLHNYMRQKLNPTHIIISDEWRYILIDYHYIVNCTSNPLKEFRISGKEVLFSEALSNDKIIIGFENPPT